MSLAIPKTRCEFCQREHTVTRDQGFKIDPGEPMPGPGARFPMVRFLCDCDYEVTVPKAAVQLEVSRHVRRLLNPEHLPAQQTPAWEFVLG